jgi:hypothetical protein
MHGDDAGIFEHEKVLVLSWNSVAVQRSTIDNRMLFGVFPCSKMVPDRSLQMFYKVFVWSLKCLADGLFPHEDHLGVKFGPNYYPHRAALAGKALAGSFIGAWSEFRGHIL